MLGASRLNTLARYVAPSGGGGEAVYSLTNSEFNASLYTNNRLTYAGDDSSGQPVFYYAYDNGSGDFEGTLIKINNDDTVSDTIVTYHATDEVFDGQGTIGRDTDGNLVAVSNFTGRFSGTIRCKAFTSSIDLDNLTFGTVYSVLNWDLTTPNAGITSVYYTGTNGYYLMSYRNSGARVMPMVVWSGGIGAQGSTENQISAIGDGVWQNFSDAGAVISGQWCYAMGNGNANQTVFAKQKGDGNYYGSSEVVYDNLSVGLAQTAVYKFNDTTYLAMAAKDAAAQAVAYSVTWGTTPTSAPSASAGSTMTFADSADWNEGFATAIDADTETAYVLYNDGIDWLTTSITHSGTALTEGTPEVVGVTTTNWNPCTSNAACIADSAQGLLFVALIDDSTTATPQLYVKPLE